MAKEQATKLHIGEGILKPGTRPIKVYVDKNGEYWLCDAERRPREQRLPQGGVHGSRRDPDGRGRMTPDFPESSGEGPLRSTRVSTRCPSSP